MIDFFLKIGSLAEIHTGRSAVPLVRGQRVIVRTTRGVELAEVVGKCNPTGAAASRGGSSEPAVRVLRPTTDQDELLIRRLQRHKRDAVEACRRELAESGSPAILLDVDQIFDGGTLILHFLGDVDPVAQRITSEVAQRYEAIVRSRHFAKLLQDGCGPDCGTKEGGGCSGGCAGCAVASACKVG